jgi:hypothetical protein
MLEAHSSRVRFRPATRHSAAGHRVGSRSRIWWICDGQLLHRYDPTTLQRVATIELGIDCGQVYATTDLMVAWTYNQDAGESGTTAAVFVDPATNQVTPRPRRTRSTAPPSTSRLSPARLIQ